MTSNNYNRSFSWNLIGRVKKKGWIAWNPYIENIIARILINLIVAISIAIIISIIIAKRNRKLVKSKRHI